MTRMNHSRGFSMIEVLVTIVLICIGVLGMVAMQGRTISYTQDSVQRNTAATLADDLLELMRADLNNVLADGQPKTTSPYYKAKGSAFPLAADDCSSLGSLTAAQRLGCWAAKVQAALPGAIDLASSDFYIAKTGSAIEVQLAWTTKNGECMDGKADSTVCHYLVRAEL